MSIQKEKELSVSIEDFKSEEARQKVKNWPTTKGEESEEIEVLVTAEVMFEDDSFDHAFGTQRQVNFDTALDSVMYGDQDILDLLSDKAQAHLIEQINKTVSLDESDV